MLGFIPYFFVAVIVEKEWQPLEACREGNYCSSSQTYWIQNESRTQQSVFSQDLQVILMHTTVWEHYKGLLTCLLAFTLALLSYILHTATRSVSYNLNLIRPNFLFLSFSFPGPLSNMDVSSLIKQKFKPLSWHPKSFTIWPPLTFLKSLPPTPSCALYVQAMGDLLLFQKSPCSLRSLSFAQAVFSVQNDPFPPALFSLTNSSSPC